MLKNQINKGITLIALVVTIIVLLILAGISVMMLTGDNGILQRAGEAKVTMDEQQEAEKIQLSYMAEKTNQLGKAVQANGLQEEICKYGEAEVFDNGDGTFYVIYKDSGNCYLVDKDGNVELSEENFELPKREFATQLSNNELGVSEDKPYEIRCIEDLLDFSLTVNGIIIENNEITYSTKYNNFNNKYVSLVKNLNFRLPLSYENAERIDYGDINQDGKVDNLLTELTTGKGWIPIGGNGHGGFCGNFNGNNKKIENLFIHNVSHTENAALFGALDIGHESTSIENLGVKGTIYCNSNYAAGIESGHTYATKNIKNCYFEGTIENISGMIGGIVAASSYGCNIEHCYVKGNINGKNLAGGIIASASGSGGIKVIITDCYNESTILNGTTIGGIVGSGAGASVYNCYNKGNIEGTGSSHHGIGGIAGYGYKIIENCYNLGNVSGTDYTGGIAGFSILDNSKISNCYNMGNIVGTNCIGGILGYNYTCNGTIIEMCYNTNEVSGNTNVGGIGGSIGKSTRLLNCYNIGTIKGKNISGIVGLCSSDMKAVSCYNVGKLEGTIKYNISNNGTIENCYYISNQGTIIGNAVEVTTEQLKTLAPILDKAYTIDEETGEITISETEIQNVWKADIDNKNQGYPIFDWQ